jgi:hypothetical protein
MRLPSVRFTVRTMMITVAVAAACLLALRGPSRINADDAVRIASGHAAGADGSFHPEHHRVSAYKLCGGSTSFWVEFFPPGSPYVVRRYSIRDDGAILQASSYKVSQKAEPLRGP